MVRITDQQLKLDVEVRDEQNKIALQSELPFFQLHQAGNGPAHGLEGQRQFKFRAINVGSDSSEARLDLLDKPKNFHLSLRDRFNIPRQGEIEFSILKPSGETFDGLKIEITAKSLRNKVRRQVFTISESGIEAALIEPAIE